MKRPNQDKTRKNKIGFLDDNTLDYYRRVYQTITSDIDGDEKELFLNNVFSQLATEAVRVSQNQTASRFIERLLVDAQPVHIKQLLSAFSSDWTIVSTDRFASHVLQDLIALSPKCGHQTNIETDAETSEKSVPELIIEYCGFVKENIETILTDTYGSHILRVLLEVLSGVEVSTDIIRSRMSKSQSKDENHWPSKSNPPEEYDGLFKKLVKKIFSFCDYSGHLTDPSSSPVYQTILLILKSRDQEACQKYLRKILKKTGIIQKHKAVEDDGEEEIFLPEILQNEVGSYLVEQVLALSIERKGQEEVYEDVFKGRLLYFAVDNIANFILQKFIDSISSKELFEEMFDELSKFTEDILAIHHIGLLSKLASGCVRVHTRQEKFMKILMDAFHCSTPEERQTSIAPLLLTLSTYEIYYKIDNDDEKGDNSEKPSVAAPVLTSINYHGSVLVQNLLRFGKTKLLVTSLLSLKPVELKTLSCDRCGSHVIDAFCQSESVGEKKRDLLLQRIKGLLIDIGCDRNGSRTLETMWKHGSVKQKVVIAEELAKHEDRLRSSNFGHFLHRNFAIGMFKHRRNDWTTEQGMANKKRKLFKDFLGDSDKDSMKVAKVEAAISNSSSKSNPKMDVVSSLQLKEDKRQLLPDEKEESSGDEDSEDEDEDEALKLLDSLVKKHGLEEDEEEVGGVSRKKRKTSNFKQDSSHGKRNNKSSQKKSEKNKL